MADFTFECHHCEVGTPAWNVLSTDMEGLRKKTRLVSSLPMKSWTLVFRLLTKDERDLILAHYNAQKGPLTPFNWTSIPNWVDTSVSYYYVRYKSYKEQLSAGTLWEVTVELELAL